MRRFRRYSRRVPRSALGKRIKYKTYARRRPINLSSIGRVAQPVQFFKRSQYQNAWICSQIGSASFKNLEFKLSDVPQVTEFTTLYDQYCIKGVRFTLMPRYNVNTPLTGTPQIPQVWSILDFDGSFPTTQDGMLQYQNLKMTPGTGYHKRYLVPAISNAIFNGGITTAYSVKKRQWIDCSDPSVPHFGGTVMIPSVNADSESCWDIKVTYYLAFKNVR